jgi:hypothetical protein
LKSPEVAAPFSIFSDRDFLASPATPHATILAPFWGTNPESPGDPDNGRFDRFAEIGSSFLRLSSLPDCDVGVFPQNWESAGDRAMELAEGFSAVCGDAGKRSVVFHGADSTDPLPVDAVVFRTSLLRSQRRPNEHAMPAWSEDFLAGHLDGKPALRPKKARPVIGFCGNTMADRPQRTFGGRVRGLLAGRKAGFKQGLAGEHPRTRALRAVLRDRRLDSNFILRDGFWAGAIRDSASLARARAEYVQNMLESEYVLCARGIGNFSYRLYEALCMARIPVFVDTDCVLPLEFDIDWRDHCVWVDADDIDRIGESVLEFHESLDEGDFQERQRACRRLWEAHLSPPGFFASFHRHFEGA